MYNTQMYLPCEWGKKLHCVTFAISLVHVYFIFFIKSKSGNQLKFQQYSALAHCSHTVCKQLCREMSDVFIAPKQWLPNIPDFNAMDYRIWAVLWEWIYLVKSQDRRGTVLDIVAKTWLQIQDISVSAYHFTALSRNAQVQELANHDNLTRSKRNCLYCCSKAFRMRLQIHSWQKISKRASQVTFL